MCFLTISQILEYNNKLKYVKHSYLFININLKHSKFILVFSWLDAIHRTLGLIINVLFTVVDNGLFFMLVFVVRVLFFYYDVLVPHELCLSLLLLTFLPDCLKLLLDVPEDV